jgi:tRNA(Ile)-lysidine synthase
MILEDINLVGRIYAVIKNKALIIPKETVIVGVSGGPDSVCLLHILKRISDSYMKIKIVAAHINHMLRMEESDGDEEYVKRLCKELGIVLYVKRVDVKFYAKEHSVSVEVAGRKIRYDFFKEVADKYKNNLKIAVGHNRNDRVETILMNLFRGTGPEGISGMKIKTGNIIRPLLLTGREEIEEYCRTNFLNPRCDSSNLRNDYTRNKIRNILIPYINKVLKINSGNSVYRFVSLLDDELDFIREYAEKCYEECTSETKSVSKAVLNLGYFNNYHIALQKRVIRMAVEKINGNLNEIENIHVENAVKLCMEGKTGSILHMPGGIRVYKSYDSVSIFFQKEDKNENTDFCKMVIIPGKTYLSDISAVVRSSLFKHNGDVEKYRQIKKDSFIQYFDYETLCKEFYIRNRRRSDRFIPLGMSGTKKLKDFFIDEKIPVNKRNVLPLIAEGNEIIWVIGYRTGEKFKVTAKTRTVLKLEYIKGLKP